MEDIHSFAQKHRGEAERRAQLQAERALARQQEHDRKVAVAVERGLQVVDVFTSAGVPAMPLYQREETPEAKADTPHGWVLQPPSLTHGYEILLTSPGTFLTQEGQLLAIERVEGRSETPFAVAAVITQEKVHHNSDQIYKATVAKFEHEGIQERLADDRSFAVLVGKLVEQGLM